MSVERKDENAQNTGYPNTVYGPVANDALAAKGAAMGTGHGMQGEYYGEWTFDFADLPSSFTSESDKSLATIPANSVLTQVSLQVLETISGGTNFTVGASQPDGTVTDADGLIPASTVTAVGAYVDGAGALVGTSLANDAQITVGGTRTAGKVKLTVKYLKLNP